MQPRMGDHSGRCNIISSISEGRKLNMASVSTTVENMTLTTFVILVAYFIIGSIITYKVGKWGANKIGWD